MSNYTRAVTHYQCLICPPDESGEDQWHYRPEFIGNSRKGGRTHFLLTNILRARLLHDHWGVLTGAQQRMVVKAISARSEIDPGWLYQWIEEDHALRLGLMFPAGTDGAAFLLAAGMVGRG